MSENKIVTFETIPQIKLGFAGIGLDEVDIINKYIDDNTNKLSDLSSQLVGQIKQDEKSKQLEFDLSDTVPVDCLINEVNPEGIGIEQAQVKDKKQIKEPSPYTEKENGSLLE